MIEFELTFENKKACIYELEKAATEIGNLLGSAIKTAHSSKGITKEEFWRNLFITKGTNWSNKSTQYMDDQPLKDLRFGDPQYCPDDPYCEMDLQFWVKYLLNGGSRVISDGPDAVCYAEDSNSFFDFFGLDCYYKGDYPCHRILYGAYKGTLHELKNVRNSYVGHITNKRIDETTLKTLKASLETLMQTLEPLCSKNWAGKKYAIALREATNVSFYQSLQEIPYSLAELLAIVNLEPENIKIDLFDEAKIRVENEKIYLNCDPAYFSNIVKSLAEMDVPDEMWVLQLRRTQERKVDMQELMKLSVINEVPLSDKTQLFNPESVTPEALREKAESGNVTAQLALAEYYMNIQKDAKLAFFWWKQAAEFGNAAAQCSVGRCYLAGTGTVKNNDEAIDWLRRAAQQGNKEAQHQVAECYANGTGVAKDVVTALSWYQRSAEQGYAKAQYAMGVCCEKGRGTDRNLLKARKWYQLAAEQGNCYAQNSLASILEEGSAGEKNPEAAFVWYRKAAEQGYYHAFWSVGRCYGNGIGTEADMKEAVVWYRKAAEAGHSRAQYSLGQCYELGKGVSKNPTEAVAWYKKAAYAGECNAQYRLAVCYSNGFGTEKDLERAANWYKEAADQRNVDARVSLGYIYYYGYGVPKSLQKAFWLFMKAAGQGNVTAQNNLALCYENGYGTVKDLEKSMQWTQKVLVSGNAEQVKKAQQRYDRLKKLLQNNG